MKQTTMLQLDAATARPQARGHCREEADTEDNEAAAACLLARGTPRRWESSTAGPPPGTPSRDLLDHRHAHPSGEAAAPHAASACASATASPVHPQASGQTAVESSRRTEALSFGEPALLRKKTKIK
jgi:hypothetical protein